MAFSEGDEAIIERIAQRVGKEIAAEVRHDTEIQVRLHASSCPLAKTVEAASDRMDAAENKAVGGWTVLAAIGSAIMAIGALVVSWFK